jgi:hypothetical protein
MGWEGIVALATGIGLVLTIAGFVFALGKLVARFEGMEARVSEDREKNSKQHEDFYSTSRCVEGLTVKMENLAKSLDELRIDVREILARLTRRSDDIRD